MESHDSGLEAIKRLIGTEITYLRSWQGKGGRNLKLELGEYHLSDASKKEQVVEVSPADREALGPFAEFQPVRLGVAA